MYTDSRVREYWIIDPAADTLVQLELSGCQFGELAMLDAGDMPTRTLLPGLEIPLGAIFQHRRRPAGEE